MHSGHRFLLLGLLLTSICRFGYTIPDLPEPVSNNAVVLVEKDQQRWLISFMGLGPGKEWQDVHNRVWAYKFGDQQWQSRTPVPTSLPLQGRLASIAVGLNGKAYLFGGYTVSEDHSEISSPDNFVYNVTTDQYIKIKDMPVPVDDSLAVTFQQRYIYLISGWHNDGNVNLVQIYDTQQDDWLMASPFPGAPVFGQAGGIVDNVIVLCDGVKVVPLPDKRRTFAAETACYKGTIDPQNITRIDWRSIPHPSNQGRYRMAASGISDASMHGVMFIGGSVNPYNYNGIGYNGKASSPDDKIWFYDIAQNRWITFNNPTPTMDHRGLLQDSERFYIPGGMAEQQRVLNRVTDFNKRELLSTINSAKQ